MGHTNNIRFIYGRYRILVVPSISEGFGLVILEAIFNGLFVICNDIPSLRSLYDRSPVIFFSYNDPHDLQLKITETLKLAKPYSKENRDM
jgi:glycosyltransferase involved in cell wall biosynthesis